MSQAARVDIPLERGSVSAHKYFPWSRLGK
jgi:hypothetical protein